MFNKTYTTNYGLKFFLITPSEWSILKLATYQCGWTDYDRHMVDLHIKNCGYGILDTEYQTPIDNEYDLDEIYTQIAESKN